MINLVEICQIFTVYIKYNKAFLKLFLLWYFINLQIINIYCPVFKVDIFFLNIYESYDLTILIDTWTSMNNCRMRRNLQDVVRFSGNDQD